ncbi:MAG: SdrD B-like domain-containing protein [Spirosomataceae bacterium]
MAASQVRAQVSGTVFKDFNMNGTKESTASNTEVGMAGVTVLATKPDGTALAVSYTGGGTATNTTGGYTVTGGTLGQIRLEFVMPDSYTFASKGATGGTTILFPGNATQNLAVNYPADYCQSTPSLVTPCYVNGRPLATDAATDAFVKYPYTASGQTHNTNNTPLAVAGKIGSVWGVAYNREKQIIYASALLKRHVAMLDNDNNGKEDIGAIYTLTPTGSPALWLDLATLGVDVGLSLMPTITARGLPADKFGPSHDADVYPLIGKIGLGDLDISDDNKQLFVVNLNDKKVYTIDIATKTLVGNGIAVPDACSGGSARPFGLKFHRGKLYVGAICDALTSQATADLKASLYRLDGTSFTTILTFPLNYVKGAAFNDGSSKAGTKWNPWKDDFYPMQGIHFGGQNNPIYPQPLLADIEFDVDESVIMTFNDRLGHQTGTLNYGTSLTDFNADGVTYKLYSSVVGGDMLRASVSGGIYTLESNATVGGVTAAAGVGNNEGPGGGEFYSGDKSLSGGSFNYHEENIQGGSALFPGKGEVAVHVSDPIDAWSGGTFWLSNTTGLSKRAYEIFPNSYNVSLFGKANGLGDIELLCDNPPIEIGNRVWEDTDNNGVQDAGEVPISGVTVTLYAADGTTIIGTATTDPTGNYYFSSAAGTNTQSAIYGLNLAFNTNYILKFPKTSGTKTLTTKDAGSNDLLDSDADADGKIAFSTGYAGENNHSFDVGYGTCAAPTPVAQNTSVCSGTTATLTASGCTAGYTTQWFDNAVASGSALATGNSFTTPSLTATTDYYLICVKDSDPTCKTATAVKVTATVKPLPVISVDANTGITCKPDGLTYDVTYTATAGATVTADKGTLDAANSKVTGVPAGQSLKLVITLNGCKDSTTVTKNCTPACTPPTPVAQNTSVCSGTTVTFTASGCTAGYTAQWFDNAVASGSALATGNSFTTPSLTATTDYYVICVKDSDPTCKTATAVKVTATVKPLPVISVDANTGITCKPDGLTYDVTYTATAGATVTADKGTLDAANSKVTGVPAGQSLKLVITLNGCKDSTTVTKNCTPACTPPTPTAQNTSFCSGTTATFTASGCTAGYTTQWFDNAAVSGTALATGNSFTTPSLTATTDYYIICVKDSDPTCKTTSPVKVTATVKPLPVISVDANTGITCKPDGLTYDVVYSATAGATVTADKGTLDAANSKVTGVPAGQSLKLIITLNGCKDSTTVTKNCTPVCVKSKIDLVGTPACSADAQTYSLNFSITNKLGTVKVNKGILTGSNPYTVTGIPSGVALTVIDSLSANCKSDTTFTGPNCNCNPQLPTIAVPNFTVCIGDTFPTIKANVVGQATVEWFATATGTALLYSGLNYKPTGTVNINTSFYAQARSTDPSCPTVISTSRVPVMITAKICIDTVDLALKKLISKKTARVGEEIEYTIKVWNESGVNATGVEVTDSLNAGVQYISSTSKRLNNNSTAGTYDPATFKWNIGNMAANGDTVALTIRVKVLSQGIWLNTAEISKTNEKDKDSTPDNHTEGEDDIDHQCFTVPISLCTGQKAEVSVPASYTGVQWFKDGGTTAIASGNTVLLDAVGTYTYKATNGTCPTEGCCPLIIEAGTNCCLPEKCVPYTVRKIKS